MLNLSHSYHNNPTSRMAYPPCKINPKFLHSNSTSHTWAFSAIAELIDNAYDPDVSASRLLIDKVDINDTTCLLFLDNGAGMDYEKLHKMLSFGFCEKDIYETKGTYKPIGHYGNGFKSGSMRLGKDALVFTRCHESASVGFLSQTYLERSGADCVVVPIVEYTLPDHILLQKRSDSLDTRNCLKAILEYSIYKEEKELLDELKSLGNSISGTKIIIYNLKLQDGSLELDFASDLKDIRCPEVHRQDTDSWEDRTIAAQISEYRTSLRTYCTILFLRPRMQIILRGGVVKSRLVAKSLHKTETDTYKPNWLDKPVKITIGFSCEKDKTEDYGMMLYHKNRLIKAYEKVGYQKQPNDKGVGVVGVAEVDFLTPTHNKQDFIPDDKFRSVMGAFGTKLNDYWNEKMEGGDLSQTSMTEKNPDCLWAQCDQCLKWRRQPPGTLKENLPDKWFCRMNRDATHNRCDIAEEAEEEDETVVRKTYKKTHKSKMKQTKEKQKKVIQSILKQVSQEHENPSSINNLKRLSNMEDDELKDHTPNKRTLRSSDTKLIISPFFNKKLQGSTPAGTSDFDSCEASNTTSVTNLLERLEESASERNLLASPLGSQESLEDLATEGARKLARTVEPDESLGEYPNLTPASPAGSLPHSESSLESITAIFKDEISEKENTIVKVNLDDQLIGEDMEDDQQSDDAEEGGTDISLSNHSQVLSPAKTSCDSSPTLLNLGRGTLYRGQAATASSSTSRSSVMDVERSLMETESEKITELKTKLALKDSIMEQMENRMRKFADNVHLLLRLICPENYDGQVDKLEETVEYMIEELMPPDDKNDIKTMINVKPVTKATTKDSTENKCSVS
ncbi:MORC family CW-type zinc finger protein 3-like [Physella acuta]|uniref:MORC family CW-type zinc finger protein 3-like n=1 Tax=Physella acuta TaxID=109671 RepID=UPI0027DD2EF4|nr:MORC family CW-type zinc finger protein 3-like [Physella acuta]